MSKRRASRAEALCYVAIAYLVAGAVAWGVVDALPDQSGWWAALWADVAATMVIWTFSVLFRNASFYDPYWTIAPIVMVAWWAEHPDGVLADPLRQGMVLFLVTAWGARLTWNWVRGWTSLDHEDWRYVMLREQAPRLWPLTNLVAIHLYPTAQVLVCLLAVHAATIAPAPFGLWDAVAVGATALGIGFEAIADEQLRRFRLSSPPNGALIETGLWAWSRHPNYFGEQLFWWGLSGMAVAADPDHAWMVIGPLSLTAMFVFGTIPMMERRLLGSRPAYAEHIARRSMLIPWPPRREA